MRLKAAFLLGCGDFFSRHPVKESPLGSMPLPLNLGLSGFQLTFLHLSPQGPKLRRGKTVHDQMEHELKPEYVGDQRGVPG